MFLLYVLQIILTRLVLVIELFLKQIRWHLPLLLPLPISTILCTLRLSGFARRSDKLGFCLLGFFWGTQKRRESFKEQRERWSVGAPASPLNSRLDVEDGAKC